MAGKHRCTGRDIVRGASRRLNNWPGRGTSWSGGFIDARPAFYLLCAPFIRAHRLVERLNFYVPPGYSDNTGRTGVGGDSPRG